ncbi:MAG: RtcB family protein, partial [Myxococcales bacterium]|nr:RtcB family protein [Myxococcales bacterium]
MSGQLHQWLCEPLTAEVRAAVGRLQRVPGVAHVALMPDVHLAHDVCIGTVVGTTATLLPAAIGGDVGCGVATLRCSATLQDLQPPGAAASVLERLAAAAPVHRHRHRLPWPEHLKVDRLSQGLRRLAQRDGAVQLGTVGRGNHFVEIQADEQDHLWIMAHSGSRAMGPAIQRHHTPSGTLATLPADGPGASSYLADLDWALDYA